MKPTRSILDNAFVYRNAANTDLRKSFARIRKQLAAAATERAAREAEGTKNVKQMVRKTGGGA